MERAATPEQMRAVLDELHCPYCMAGPWRSVAKHINHAHDLTAAEVKEAAGIPRSRSLVSPETRALLAKRATERDCVTNMRKAPRRPAVEYRVSEAGRDQWRENVKHASVARQRIGPEEYATIKQRCAAGELKSAIAAEYGVSRTRIRQIEQGLEYVLRKIAPR